MILNIKDAKTKDLLKKFIKENNLNVIEFISGIEAFYYEELNFLFYNRFKNSIDPELFENLKSSNLDEVFSLIIKDAIEDFEEVAYQDDLIDLLNKYLIEE